MAVKTVNAQEFEQTVTDNDIVVVDFWATWCGPCVQFAPVFDKMSQKHDDVTFAKLDIDQNNELAGQMGVTAVPTLMAFRDGVLVFNQAGALNGPQLDQVLTKVKELDMDQVRADIAAAQD